MVDQKLKGEGLDELFKAILALKTVDECYDFFDDLCTRPELKSFSQRYEVAELLLHKTVYSEIVKKTGASTATISRVNRSLSFGNDGYAMVLKRLKKI
ncbi:MAG: YerC/YecD family TrpR-related protein [Oscillospiraceae bacterium]|nr:YerC/YecD family TrpR-related protein [Oscillospiraceae bacterium]